MLETQHEFGTDSQTLPGQSRGAQQCRGSSENAGSSSGSSLVLLLWSLNPDWFSQADHYRNTAAGFGARGDLDVCDSTTLHCTGLPFEYGLFLAFIFFFFSLLAP